MPIYEYECNKCGHAFEREQRMSEPPVKTCPRCKGRKVTKLISQTSFVLKGGGWYADGYSDSKKSASAEAPSASDAAASSDGAATTKTDGGSPRDSTKTSKPSKPSKTAGGGKPKASSKSAA